MRLEGILAREIAGRRLTRNVKGFAPRCQCCNRVWPRPSKVRGEINRIGGRQANDEAIIESRQRRLNRLYDRKIPGSRVSDDHWSTGGIETDRSRPVAAAASSVSAEFQRSSRSRQTGEKSVERTLEHRAERLRDREICGTCGPRYPGAPRSIHSNGCSGFREPWVPARTAEIRGVSNRAT